MTLTYYYILQGQLDNLLKAGACSNAANTQVNKCYTQLIDKYLECIPRDVQGVQKCTPIAVDSMLGFIKSMTGNIIDMFCSDYTEGSDKCEKLEKPPKKLKSQRRAKSFAIPMIDDCSETPQLLGLLLAILIYPPSPHFVPQLFTQNK
ncbi:unnamed protein product [Oppiella nova]|uniref:Uncharacterized protein n=1 Tax=Oppiella nova TaxID=334625 RepID=A0A7R9LHH2_9ACAR|nr:unnamed protein product [Oppiella nova]CAG2163584.1 unnamed protein product [Oppiella nova]